ALLCLIQHNSSQTKLDWLIIFNIIKEFDPNYNFLNNLKEVKFDEKYLKEIKSHINNDVELFENKLKILQWLLKLCKNMESIFQVWNILLIRNKQITQYFINRIQELISNSDTITLLYHHTNIPKDFHDRVSYLFRKRILNLLSKKDKSWENPNLIALMEIFKFDDLKWNDDDILTCLESISNSHNKLLLENFPRILYYWLHKGFYDKSVPTICRNWIKLLLLKLGIKNTPEEESRHAISIFQLLDYIYPFICKRIDIWNDISSIILDKMKDYSDYCILGATKSMMKLKEQDIKRLFIEISKERLNKSVKKVNDQLMDMIIIICGYEIETFKFPLDIPNTMCEDILCYIMFLLQNQSNNQSNVSSTVSPTVSSTVSSTR
ncbi:4810_t:CDS:2, partial [Rhizophagus irregularis]